VISKSKRPSWPIFRPPPKKILRSQKRTSAFVTLNVVLYVSGVPLGRHEWGEATHSRNQNSLQEPRAHCRCERRILKVSRMSYSREQPTNSDSLRFFSSQQIDDILHDGSKRGRTGSHAAIERILRLEPEVRRTELWKRIRELKFSKRQSLRIRSKWGAEDERVLREGYAAGWQGKRNSIMQLLRRHPDWRPHVIWQRARKIGLVQMVPRRGRERSGLKWTGEDHRVLMDLAGYKSVRMIAKMLHRSEAAIRYHLATLGESSRVHKEGYARSALAKELHISIGTIQRFIADGLLEVRDPRITRESMDRLKKSGRLSMIRQAEGVKATSPLTPYAGKNATQSDPSPTATDSSKSASTPGGTSRSRRVWSELAASQEISAKAVRSLIAQGVLRFYDPTITETSLRQFCRRHGSFIRGEYLSRETREWLKNSMDWVPTAGEMTSHQLEPLRKHAAIIRRCMCGRSVRGNAFFRHASKCNHGKIETLHDSERKVPDRQKSNSGRMISSDRS